MGTSQQRTEGVGGVQKRRTILVADDHDLVRQMMRAVLEDEGYRVIEARDGLEARRLLAEHIDSLDLAIVDGVMPGEDGASVLSFARELCPLLPVVLSSGYGPEKAFASLAHLVEFLPKPYDSVELVDKVSQMLASADRRDSCL